MPSFTTNLLACTLTVMPWITSTAEAQPMGGEQYLRINAETDFAALHPGDMGLLAIDIVVDEGWHTYWPGISDTGYGIAFDIHATDSVELKDPIWPTPMRYLQRGGILDHTYEGTQTVLVPFVIKDDTPETPGSPEQTVSFTINADFLVCKDICLPGKGTTGASLRIVDPDEKRVQTSRHDELRELYRQRPGKFDPTDPSVRMQWISSAAAIMFRDATRIEFYPDTENSLMVSVIEDGTAEGNRIEIRFAQDNTKPDKNQAPTAHVLSGRLRVSTRDGIVHYDIHEKSP